MIEEYDGEYMPYYIAEEELEVIEYSMRNVEHLFAKIEEEILHGN